MAAPPSLPPYARLTEKGVEVFIWAKPGARQEKILGLKEDAQGQCWLHVAVTAAPEDGKANAALVVFLASAFSVRKTDIEFVQGAQARQKRFLLRGRTNL